MEEIKSNAGQGLGTAGLILGILAIPLGIIPCTFILGILFGLGGIVLSIVALTQANRWNAPKALIIAALTCSILGFSFAAAWSIAFSHRDFFFRQVIDDIREGRSFDEIMEDREQAIANGLLIPDEKTCLKCHNADAPEALAASAKDFNFEKMRATGVHAMPEKAAEETKK